MPKRPPDPATREDVEALLASAAKSWYGARSRALVALLYRAGLRCNEAIHVHVEDLNFRAPACVWVRQPKYLSRGAPQRKVGLDARTVELLKAWLERRGGKGGFLFVTRNGKQLGDDQVRDILPRLARKAGVTRRIHAHGLRHGFAGECYREGIGLREIQESLGHRSLATTETYLRHIGATEAVEATAARTW